MNNNRDRRFRQADREALLALTVYALYFIWWYVFGFGMGNNNPDEYTYVWGFPAWFFYSCIAGYPVITIVLWIIVRTKFKDMPLEAEITDAEFPDSAGDSQGEKE
ncbi:YhdT family protein [Maridesulfovibrio sp.]|uniref:YhdT family protein n=1 Tax=Maridesulfovibrio sp. TaxID=2795000 RepID=UPI002A1869DA|nr:YhdT family protein [Maridesulfovibrio sp.]